MQYTWVGETDPKWHTRLIWHTRSTDKTATPVYGSLTYLYSLGQVMLDESEHRTKNSENTCSQREKASRCCNKCWTRSALYCGVLYWCKWYDHSAMCHFPPEAVEARTGWWWATRNTKSVPGKGMDDWRAIPKVARALCHVCSSKSQQQGTVVTWRTFQPQALWCIKICTRQWNRSLMFPHTARTVCNH